MSRKYEFFPAWDGGKASPIILKVVELAGKRWKAKNLGTYVNRDMRDQPGQKSVHATGYAADLGGDMATLQAMWTWYLKHSAQIGLQELHFYKKPGTKYGAGYRASRGEGEKGVKIYTATDNAGPGGLWLHIEVSQNHMTPEEYETYFRANKD